MDTGYPAERKLHSPMAQAFSDLDLTFQSLLCWHNWSELNERGSWTALAGTAIARQPSGGSTGEPAVLGDDGANHPLFVTRLLRVAGGN